MGSNLLIPMARPSAREPTMRLSMLRRQKVRAVRESGFLQHRCLTLASTAAPAVGNMSARPAASLMARAAREQILRLAMHSTAADRRLRQGWPAGFNLTANVWSKARHSDQVQSPQRLLAIRRLFSARPLRPISFNLVKR